VKCRIQEVWQEEEVDDALKEGCFVSKHIRRGRRQQQELVIIYMDVRAARKTEHWDFYKERRSMEFYLEDIRRRRSSPCTKIPTSNHHTKSTNRALYSIGFAELLNICPLLCFALLGKIGSLSRDVYQKSRERRTSHQWTRNSSL